MPALLEEFVHSPALWWSLLVGAGLVLLYTGARLWTWSVSGLVLLIGFSAYAQVSVTAKVITWAVCVAPFLVAALPPLRRALLSGAALALLRDSMPRMSDAERISMQAGSVGWDAELLRGAPRWRYLLKSALPRLENEERAFLDGSVEALCAQLAGGGSALTEAVWETLAERGFLGLAIPRQHGGQGFSPCAIAAVLHKVASRSLGAGLVLASVNGMGVARILVRHGTEQQRETRLPRIAAGRDVAALAVSSVHAGSDAHAVADIGTVYRPAAAEGSHELAVRLSFDKRYVPLSTKATLLLVAVRLRDPEKLLGRDEDLGVTLMLVPTTSQGVDAGPAHACDIAALQLGAVRGRDVSVPLDAAVGGRAGIGEGWRMLVETAVEARALTVPALGSATLKLAARVCGAYARIRYQFNSYIGKSEGIQEALARIAGHAWALEAGRMLALSALDGGGRPAVIGRVLSRQAVERARAALADAADILAGAAICAGPGGPLREHQAMPAAGAALDGGLLTRNGFIFAQALIRAHPYLGQELDAAASRDAYSERRFDVVFRRHLAHAAGNAFRTLVLGLTGGRMARAPRGVSRRLRRHFRAVSRLSAALALVSDALVFSLRGELNSRQRLTGRMGDALGQLYIASCALAQHHMQGLGEEGGYLVDWVARDCLQGAATELRGVLENFPSRLAGRILMRVVFPFGLQLRAASDELDARVAGLLLVPSSMRDRLTSGIFIAAAGDPLSRLEKALAEVVKTKPALRKLRDAARVQLVEGLTVMEWLERGLEAGVLTEDEAEALRNAERARLDALRIDG